MKAATWRGWLLPAACLLALVAASPVARASTPGTPGLPAGLPELPALGEVMQRDLRTGLAINGFDPVSYRLGKPAAGLPAYELMQGGVVWRFASQANLEAFRDAPEIYAPAFGGFDPTGVADGAAVDSDPSQFTIVGSRLFLFRTAENRRRFLQDAGGLLVQAEDRWISVLRFVAR